MNRGMCWILILIDWRVWRAKARFLLQHTALDALLNRMIEIGMFTLLILFTLFILAVTPSSTLQPISRPTCGKRKHSRHFPYKSRRKPDWVVTEIIRLAALMPDSGCRKLADTFNRLHLATRNTIVSKSYVNERMRKHHYAILNLRRTLKHRQPRAMPINQVWGIDMTGKVDVSGHLHNILGIIDHGSRRALALVVLPNKSTWTLLGYLFIAIGQYGRPRALRTDNESVFSSWLFRSILRVADIRHQQTERHCPWQNGRIERLFGTLKVKLDQFCVADSLVLQTMLGTFRFWYNHVRPHQHLAGLTPTEAWCGVDPYQTAPRSVEYVREWDGALTGFYLRR
jgi:putative transposase